MHFDSMSLTVFRQVTEHVLGVMVEFTLECGTWGKLTDTERRRTQMEVLVTMVNGRLIRL
jgi:hypothetical protein